MKAFSSARVSDFYCDNQKSAIRNLKWSGVVALVVAVAMGGATAQAQQLGKVPLIGILGSSSASGAGRSQAIRAALRELGYIKGQNIAIEERYFDGVPDQRRRAEIVAELVRLKIDVIVVAGGDNVIRPTMNATKTIPIVLMGQGSDPVAAGFVESLARPGGNITGLSNLATNLGGKKLELLKEAVPKLVRVGVLYDPTAPGSTREVKEDVPVAARALGLSIQPWEVRDASGFETVFAALNKERPDGLYVSGGGSLMRDNVKRTASLALKSRLPSVYPNSSRAAVEEGGLMSYGPDQAGIYRLVAWYVDRILKGAKPADLPVQQPMKFELVINLKTAKQIGLIIPPNILTRADKVIR